MTYCFVVCSEACAVEKGPFQSQFKVAVMLSFVDNFCGGTEGERHVNSKGKGGRRCLTKGHGVIGRKKVR